MMMRSRAQRADKFGAYFAGADDSPPQLALLVGHRDEQKIDTVIAAAKHAECAFWQIDLRRVWGVTLA